MAEHFLHLDGSDRRDAYEITAQELDLPAAVIEKDVWICWVLDVLYRDPSPERYPMAFKGGTSLSKVFDAIVRFSEDVDLTIGVSPASFEDGEIPASRNQRDKLRGEVEEEPESNRPARLCPFRSCQPCCKHRMYAGGDVLRERAG